MKAAIPLAADIIRSLQKAGFEFDVWINPDGGDEFLPPKPGREPHPFIRIRLPDHTVNFFQPLTCIDIDVRPGEPLPRVRARNLYSFRSPKSNATEHTFTRFTGRLKQHDACFPMHVQD